MALGFKGLKLLCGAGLGALQLLGMGMDLRQGLGLRRRAGDPEVGSGDNGGLGLRDAKEARQRPPNIFRRASGPGAMPQLHMP